MAQPESSAAGGGVPAGFGTILLEQRSASSMRTTPETPGPLSALRARRSSSRRLGRIVKTAGRRNFLD